MVTGNLGVINALTFLKAEVAKCVEVGTIKKYLGLATPSHKRLSTPVQMWGEGNCRCESCNNDWLTVMAVILMTDII